MGAVEKKLGVGARASSTVATGLAPASGAASSGEAARLDALLGYGVLDTAPEEAFDRLTALAADLFDAPVALVSLIDAERQWFKSRVGIEAAESPRAWAFCDRLIAAGPGAVMVVEDATGDPRFAQNPLVTAEQGVRFYAGAALTTAEGHNLGSLCVIDHEPRPSPSPRMLERLRTLAAIVVDELELRRTGRALAQRRQLLDLAAGMSKLGHWRYNIADCRMTWSDEAYRIHGVSPESFQPDLIEAIALFEPEDRPRLLRAVSEATERGTGFSLRLRMRHAGGEVRDVSLSATCERDDAGRVAALLGIVQDITENEQALRKAQLNESRYRFLADNMGDVVTRVGVDGSCDYTSPAVKSLLGFTPDEIALRPALDFIHPDDRDGVQSLLDGLASGRQQRATTQLRALHRDGHAVWVEINAQISRGDAEDPPGIVAVIRDITERKALETETVRAREAAEDHARRADAAEALAGLGHWRYEPESQTLIWSDQLYRIYGLSPDAKIDVGTVQSMMHPDDVEARLGRIGNQIATGESDEGSVHRILRGDGEVRYLESRSAAEYGPDGAVRAVVGTLVDVTERKRAEAAVAESEARYRELAEHSSDVTLRVDLTDPRQPFTYVSPAVRRLGWTPEEILGQPRAAYIHPEDLSRETASAEALANGVKLETVEDREYRVRMASGGYLWMEANRSIVRNELGEPLEAITVLRDIAERKMAQAALAESEARYRQLAENSSDIALRARMDDPERRIIYISAAVRSLGWEPEEVIGKSRADFVHPQDRDRLGRTIAALLKGDPLPPVEDREFRVLTKSGDYVWMESSPSIVHDAAGVPVEVISVMRDIDERKVADIALAESEARYRLVTEASRDMVLKYGLDATILYVSGACRQFGYEPEDLIGKNGFDQIHPDDHEQTRSLIVNRLRDDAYVQPDHLREFRVRTADGSWVWVVGNPSVVRDPEGRPVAFVNSLREITSRKAVETALAASEARYRGLADAAPDMISESGLDGTIHYISPACEAITGNKPELAVGRNAFSLMHPEDAPRAQAACQAIIDSRGQITPDPVQYRSRHRDGREIWLESRPAAMKDHATGEVVGFIDVIRDITARKAMEAELEHARAAAEHAAAVKGDFLANMTHELRTPLNAIVGFSGLLKQSAALNEQDARQVGLIHDASQTLLGVVNDVLDFSKLEAGAIDFDLHPFDPRLMAETTVALLAGQAAAKGLIISVSATGREGALLGDGARLRQVLLNFVSNAIKFTASGSIDVRLDQSGDGELARLRVEVQDSGIGVPADQIGAIFGRFTQADASVSRNFGGTGLGLAICKRIVEALGGEIGVESRIGEGSTFWFEVAMAPAEAEAAPAVCEAGAGRGPAAVEQTLRLLVVDDNAVNRELVCALLGPFDIDIATAADGVEAVELASRRTFDLILMDVQMPNMDGLTAARRIRAATAPEARRVPIIAMTANVLPEQVARCLDAGMDDHLGKPISPAKLLEALNRWSAPPAEDDQSSQPGMATPAGRGDGPAQSRLDAEPAAR